MFILFSCSSDNGVSVIIVAKVISNRYWGVHPSMELRLYQILYRLPDSSFSSFITDFLKLVDSTNTKDIIAIGDFNIHMNKSCTYMVKFFQSTLIRLKLITYRKFSQIE